MSNYKNILNLQSAEYNSLYKLICKQKPSMSLKDKSSLALKYMLKNRNLNVFDLFTIFGKPFTKEYQYAMELVAMSTELELGINRYYLKDDSLFDFFKNTEIRKKEVQSILDTLDNGENCTFWGVLGKEFSFTLGYTKTRENKHIISIFTDTMNYTFCMEEFDDDVNKEIFNLGMNFLFYINAFPECVIEGVPNGVKRNPKAKMISTSDKIISHTTVEHGFIRPHFRSGYFRHFNSDYYVNCKGQVRFIEATMVKGKAKTVIERENN